MSVAKIVRNLALFCTCTAASILSLAQNGSVAGSVTDLAGNPVFAASVTLVSSDGPTHSQATSVEGKFLLKELPSGTYTLKAIAPGFSAFEQPSVAVAVGRTTHLYLQLALAGVLQTVSVRAGESTFDASQTSSVVNVDRDRVEELPIPSRNYLTFVLLSPQAAAANPALPQGGSAQSTGSFSFGGLRPGSNAVYLDGVNDDDEYSGGSRTQLSPEAISDFQIVNHGFAAESGGGAGGSVDVETRSGLNRIHGDAFTFVQNGALNGTPPLEFAPYKPDESRMRAGIALGGPIQRNKTFYYVAAEQEVARGEEANDLKPATLSAINTALKQYGPMSTLTLQTGFFPTTDQETELSGRIDRTLTANEAIMLRYAFTNSRNVKDAFNTDELTDRTARGSSFLADNSLNGTLSSTFNPSLLNKLSFELAQRRAVDRTESTLGPGILIPGVALFGTPYSGNDRHFESHLEFADSLTLEHGQHLFKFGARVDRVALRTQVPDGSQGLFVFPTLAAFQAGGADFFTQTFGNFNTNLTDLRLSGFAQDHWTPSRRLTLDYGMRYEYNRLPQDMLNFSPRVGLAWTPWKSMVVRSGFGLFYDRFLLSTTNRLLELDGVHGYSQMVEDTAAAAVYRGGSIPSAPLAGMAPSIWRAQPGLRNPYSEVASFGLEQALPLQTTLSAEYQYVHGVRLGRTSNINLAPPVIVTPANAASLGISSPTTQQLSRPAFSTARLNSAYDAINQFASSGDSGYHGATVTINRQFQDDLQIMAGYTFSKTIDDGSYDTEQPQNPYVPGGERALSLQDQRQRFTLSGLWLIGPDLGDAADAARNANPGPIMKALTGFEFAPILSIASGFRANPITGLDSGQEHIFPFASRPAGYGRNSLATSRNIDLDLRILRIIPLGNGHLDVVAESFNLLNHRNVALVNTTYGSNTSSQGGFDQPIAASTARRVQFSLDYEF
ncbi:MAG: carboxypeptidase regulatory-like domain-containing protein [Acidobacteriota bacterium]|nr:carboxypeptidase regulatory-like domain-containing protein [Acidobacteriota bacterium]